jgi:septum site-determining protein MinC
MESEACFQFKASFAPCTIFQLIKHDLEQLQQQLAAAVARAPDFFRGVPVVIDLEKISEQEVPDFLRLKDLLAANGMVPVGVRSGSPEQLEVAARVGLLRMAAGKLTESDAIAAAPKTDKVAKAAKPVKTTKAAKLITTPIRSGMQVYAKDTDLIVLSSVSAGAELLADGHIHVYGPLRGRALAGVQGKLDARIFCASLEAELVAIAGFYLTREDMQALPETHGMIQVYLDGETVKIAPVLK